MRALGALIVLSAGLGSLAAAGRTWLVVTVQDPVLGGTQVDVDGATATGTGTAVALLLVAAGLVALLTRGWSGRLGLLLAVPAGLWQAFGGLRVLSDPGGAAAAALGDLSSGGPQGPVTTGGGGVPEAISAAGVTGWPWAATVAGVVAVAAAVVAFGVDIRSTARRATLRPAPAPSYPAPGGPARLSGEEQRHAARAAWDELSAGRDPTLPGENPPGTP